MTTPNDTTTPDLAESVREAQAAGDLAYREAEDAGLSAPDPADIYHAVFLETLRSLGLAIQCPCPRCTYAAEYDAYLDEQAAQLDAEDQARADSHR